MSTNPVAHSASGRSLARWIVRALVCLLFVGVGVGGWMAYRGVTVSLEAERNLHATLFAVRLVEQFVSEQRRWPRSWEELESLPTADELFGRSWPAAAEEVLDATGNAVALCPVYGQPR